MGVLVSYNIWLLTVNIVLIFAFFISWYRSYKKTGWAIDPWHFFLLMSYFMPFLLMYPFAGAELNSLFVGNNIGNIQPFVSQAYLIALVGYMSIFIGGKTFLIFNRNNFINYFGILPIRKTLGALFKNVVLSQTICNILLYFYFLCLAIVLLIAYKGGSFNDPRAYFYLNDNLRVIYNTANSLSGIVGLVLIARIFQFDLLSDKIYFSLFVVVTFFIGARAAALGPLLVAFTYVVYFSWKGRLKFKKLALFGTGFVFIFLTLTFFRSGAGGSGNALIEIFYGNSFSDLRDFAWVLSAWDGHYFYGKTYLSAFISFIPTNYSSFRNEYNIGRITAILGGFNPSEHPGLRPGMFGESYLNFGIIGVIFLGVIMGYSLKMLDSMTKYYSYTKNKLEVFTTSVSTMVITNLTITSGFFTVYVFLMIFLFLNALRIIINSLKTVA